MRLIAALPLALLAAAASAQAPQATPQWPPAPAPARLRFVEEIRLPQAPRPQGHRTTLDWLKLLLGIESASRQAALKQALRQPTGLFVRDAILYVADPARSAVLRYDLNKKEGCWLGRAQGLDLASPVAVAGSRDGRLFILDSARRRVLILDARNQPAGELHGDPEGLGQPAGLAVSDSRVYVSDVSQHRVSVYGLEGVFTQSFGRRGKEPGEFNFPTYLWFDRPRQQLWAADSANFRLQWFDASGRPIGLLGKPGDQPGYLARPRGVARDSEGHVYVSDAAFDALQIFDTQGRLLLFVGVSGEEPGQFNLPGGVFIDEKDRVFVADTYNGRVQIFQYFRQGS